MRKEELDRRSAELKARMLAQRNEGTQEKPSTGTKRMSKMTSMQLADSVAVPSNDSEEVSALKKRIAKLEAENASLRQPVGID